MGAEPAPDDGESTEPTRVDAEGLPDRVVPVPVTEARYFGLRAVKGGLAWCRAPAAPGSGWDDAAVCIATGRTSGER